MATGYNSIKQTTAYVDDIRPRKVRKAKKMGWFKRKFAQWCREAWENENDPGSECTPLNTSIGRDHTSDERITLRLDKAIGGHIISVSKYNSKVDRHRDNTYIIRDDDNLEEALTAVFIQEKLNQ